MNKKFISLIALTLVLPLVGCSKAENNASNTIDSDSNVSSDNHSSSSDKEDGLHKDSHLDVFMFGNLYKNGSRSIYAMRYGVDGTLEWKSSNESIVTIGEPIDGELPEVLLLANGTGKAVITCSLKDDPSIYTEYEIDTLTDEYLEMDASLYSTISSSVKMTSIDNKIDYDSEYKPIINSSEKIVSIYEENEDQSSSVALNLTDAFQTTVMDMDTSEITMEHKYVRDGRYLASEYIDYMNRLRKERLSNTDGEDMYWLSTYYYNYFGNSDHIDETDFVSYDGGKTYHFIGGYNEAEYLMLSLYQSDFTPDDLYFTVENDKIVSFNAVVDPTAATDSDELILEKYGREVVTKFSDEGTATIDHLATYSHESIHDKIDAAKNNMASLKNYTATLTMDFETGADYKYVYTYTEDTIDIKSYQGNQLLSHTGVHKKDDNSYYEYERDDSNDVTTITKDHPNAIFDGKDKDGKTVNRYPTFAFASEIFEKTSNDSTYQSRGYNGQFISYCNYIPSWSVYYSYQNDGTITLDDDNHITNAKTKITIDEDSSFDLVIDYDEFSTSKVDIDFSKAVEKANPSSFEESNPNLVKQMKSWNFDGVLPYIYVEQGYSDDVSFERNSDDTVSCAYIRVLPFDTEALRDSYISSYESKLVETGFAKLDETDSKGYTLYENGDYKVSVGAELNWNGNKTNGVIIRVYSSKLTRPE